MAWTIVGLGNPGSEYDGTRHNTGRMAVEMFAKKHDFEPWKKNATTVATVAKGLFDDVALVAVLPDTFMNKSGAAVMKYVKSAKAAKQLVVVYDDLDLPIGAIKISFDRSSGGHRGLESIIRSLKSQEFARIRIGVSPTTPSGKIKKPHGEDEVIDFILKKFKPTELDELKKVFKRTSDALETIVTEGYVKAMNEYNK